MNAFVRMRKVRCHVCMEALSPLMMAVLGLGYYHVSPRARVYLTLRIANRCDVEDLVAGSIQAYDDSVYDF